MEGAGMTPPSNIHISKFWIFYIPFTFFRMAKDMRSLLFHTWPLEHPLDIPILVTALLSHSWMLYFCPIKIFKLLGNCWTTLAYMLWNQRLSCPHRHLMKKKTILVSFFYNYHVVFSFVSVCFSTPASSFF